MEIIRFTKQDEKYKCFSNFYHCKVTYDGMTYLSSEAAWQAQKTEDERERLKFTTIGPSVAKRMGRSVSLRWDWEDVKDALMVSILLQKFGNNAELKEILISTGDAEIIEDTTGWHDNIWGDCRCSRCISRPGQNRLGKALMRVRTLLTQDLPY